MAIVPYSIVLIGAVVMTLLAFNMVICKQCVAGKQAKLGQIVVKRTDLVILLGS